MQAIPSLIGSGTAVAAATTGLVFGQLADGQLANPEPPKRTSSLILDFTSRPRSRTRIRDRRFAPQDLAEHRPPSSPTALVQQPSPAPSTNPSPPQPRQSSDARLTPPRSSSRRPPTASSRLLGETGPAEPRDSLSSNGSWFRRLPLRPLSRHGSLRSSVGQDTNSIAFSHASGAPILGAPRSHPVALPPNKLVKRASAANSADPIAAVQLGSRPQLTLRRPATSHQRSATLQQQIDVEALSASLNSTSFDCQTRTRAQTLVAPRSNPGSDVAGAEQSWKSFWHVRVARHAAKSSTFRPTESSWLNGAKRICLEEHTLAYVYLVKPIKVMMAAKQSSLPDDTTQDPTTETSSSTSDNTGASPEGTPSKAPQRSTSLKVSSPTSWISAAGSIRLKKRGDTASGVKRAVSAPIEPVAPSSTPKDEPAMDFHMLGMQRSRAEADLTAIFRPPGNRQSSTSPMPPKSRNSSIPRDRALALTESPTQAGISTDTTSPSMRIDSRGSHARSNDRASTVASSEYYRGFTSGEDDDADIKTDTPYDSFRTAASSHRKTGDTTLDCMFDESPPGSAGPASRAKRLSIQEILGFSYDEKDRIIEEDESIPTPVHAEYDIKESNARISPPNDKIFNETNKDFRVSFDDDDDLEWAQEDEMHMYNNLSPPSSTNSRRASPSLRMALSAINGNMLTDNNHEHNGERPRSTVFDWVEQPAHEKQSGESRTRRPMTAYGKKSRDMRGGRSASRKGPVAAHIRSQSVPVVQDPAETKKPIPRFGTWGLGSKNVSEDWDEDFEFDEAIPEDPTESTAQSSRPSMVVPPSIQATQHTLKTHSGQIRELSLLVNDLKRLCRLGREMHMLDGDSMSLWLEAEDVIALASPDEEEPGDADCSNTVREAGLEKRLLHSADEHFRAQGFDGSSLDTSDHLIDRTSRSEDRNDTHPSVRRRSVFSPEDDIFGTWDHLADSSLRPSTPENRTSIQKPSTATKAVIEAMRSRVKHANLEARKATDHELSTRLNFDTNSLRDLVKRAGELRDALSDMVRAVDCITQSPAWTTRRSDRPDGSPAFTRVFDEPTNTPPRRPPLSHGNSTTSFNGNSLSTSPTTGLSQRLHMMTVG
ncbi:Septation protein etd1 [Microdochium nivale]|nr:Septation protein etd1 [Microdochium nivale]